MKSIKISTLLLLLTSVGLSFNLNAQCIDFVKTKGFEKLDTERFVPEGRFDALTLSCGDNLTVYKSFFRGKTYKVVVVGEGNVSPLKFQVKTMQGDVIYSNSQNEKSESWEYTSDRNQNLKITIELPASSGAHIESGCVAVILGYKM